MSDSLNSTKSSLKLRKIKGIRQPPNAATVELIEELLELAKSGAVQNFAATVLYSDACTSYWWGLRGVNEQTMTNLIGETHSMLASMTMHHLRDADSTSVPAEIERRLERGGL